MALEARRQVIITITMDEDYAAKVMRSLQRVRTAITRLDRGQHDQLVNTGTVDDLLALDTAIRQLLTGLGGESDAVRGDVRD